MMSRVLKTAEFPISPYARIGAICLAAVLIHAASGVTDPAAAQKGWSTSVESQAEFAYRSVYERSLNSQKPAKAAKRRSRSVMAPAATGAIIPDFPERKPEALRAVPAPIVIDTPPIEAKVAAAPTNTGWQALVDPHGNPVLHEPSALANIITTQVINQEPNAPAANAKPRGPGEQYCSNIANAASDARFAWQKQTLVETEKQVKERLEELNAKITEYQKWLARRDEFSRKAEATITNIYAKMKPDAAAQQLAVLDEETAAAVITKLNPRVASALMAEMDPKQAARLTAIISASGKGPKGKAPAAPKPQNGKI